MAAVNVWDHNNEEYRAESIARLRRYFPIGTEASLILRHVSASGMYRAITVLAYDKDEKEIVNVSRDVARALGWQVDNHHNAVAVSGTGMDMGFHLVYSLSHSLYKNSRSKKIKRDAGYALTHTYL